MRLAYGCLMLGWDKDPQFDVDFLDGSIVGNGWRCARRSGFCMEPHALPGLTESF